jgi:hypothetical protein
MSPDPPSRLFVAWSWVWWLALLAAVPVQAVVIGMMNGSSVSTFRSVGSAIRPTPGAPPPGPSPREVAGDAATEYLGWLPFTQIVLAAVIVILPNRPVKTALRPYHLWVWVPLASVPVAWVCCRFGHDLIHSPPL